MDPIIIPSENGNWCVSPEKIIRVQSMDNYSKIIFKDAKPLVVSKVLLWFEIRLPHDMFTRVHRSHLVNKNYVAAINGSVFKYVQLMNGDIISISRRKKHFAINNLGIVTNN
ncbi:MAG: LytTR family DNA-binding domain-containing protein [Bacteroidota bacterium]